MQRTLIALLLLAALTVAQPALAQSNTFVTARAYAPVPDVDSVLVVPKQDSDLNQRLTAEFERTLTAAGYRLAAGGLEWHFDTTVSSDPANAPPIDIFGTFGNRSGANDFGATFRLPLTGRAADERAKTFRMLVELRTEDEDLTWTAVMQSNLTRLDRFNVGRLMTPELVAIIGEDYDHTAITLD